MNIGRQKFRRKLIKKSEDMEKDLENDETKKSGGEEKLKKKVRYLSLFYYFNLI